MKVSDAIEWLKKFHKPDETICMILWSEDDVLERAEEREMEIEREDARRVIHWIYKYHDASIGINWDTIDCYLDEIKMEKDVHSPEPL